MYEPNKLKLSQYTVQFNHNCSLTGLNYLHIPWLVFIVSLVSCASGLLKDGLKFSSMMDNATDKWHNTAKLQKKTGSVQKVVTLNTCCNAVCLTSMLPHNITGFFHSHQCLKGNNTFNRMNTSAFHKAQQWHFLHVVGKFIITVTALLF